MLYEFGVMLPVFLSFLASLLVAGIHALARPVHHESYFINSQQAKEKAQEKMRPAVVHSDGFQDHRGEEQEMTFVQVDVADQSQNESHLRNRNVARNSLCTQDG